MNFDPKYPDANMIIKMLLIGYKIKEIPAIMYVRVAGVSIHSGLKPILYMLLMMLSTLTVILKYKLFNLKKGDRLDKNYSIHTVIIIDVASFYTIYIFSIRYILSGEK